MLRFGGLLGGGLIVVLVTLAGGSAIADPVVCVISQVTGQCVGQLGGGGTTQPIGGDGDINGGTGGGAASSDSAPRICTSNYLQGHQINCEGGLGSWSQSRQCYLGLAQPQPPLSDPVWDGRADGAIYSCTGADRVGDIPVFDFWSLGFPTDVDPEDLAMQAVFAMQLRAIGVSTNPTQRSYVNLPTWLGVADADEHTVGPIIRSASAGGVSVEATARMTHIVWSTGDGGGVTCQTPAAGWGDAETTGDACSHVYQRASVNASGGYEIAATTYWTVTWAGAGQTGQIELDFTSADQLAVAEIQSLVRN